MISVKEKEYGGWKRTLEITNGLVDLFVTLEVGPRIIRYGFVGDTNVFYEKNEDMGKFGEDKWRIYGGHRLWYSPEDSRKTTQPDNSKIHWRINKNDIIITQDVEQLTKVQKEIIIRLDENSSGVEVVHRIINKGIWPIEVSVWPITVMKAGGISYIPRVNTDTGLLPNMNISFWSYTDLNDSRLSFSKNYIKVKHDFTKENPFKIGVLNEEGWAVYFIENKAFIKKYDHIKNAKYPDFGVSYECYVCKDMLEMESLSPLKYVNCDEMLEHKEFWKLINNVSIQENEDKITELIKLDL